MSRSTLTAEQIQFYQDNGYLAVKGRLDISGQKELLADLDSLIKNECKKLNIDDKADAIDYGLMQLKKAAPHRSSWVFETTKTSLGFLNYVFTLPLAGDVAQLLACDEKKLGVVSPNFRMDAPEATSTMRKWHMDSSYFLDVDSGAHALVAWIPFGIADEFHGSVKVIPGSQRWNKKTNVFHEPSQSFASEQYTLNLTFEEESQAIILRAEPGDVVYMNFDIIHETHINQSNKIRYTAIIRYTDNSSENYRPVRYKTNYQDYSSVRNQ